MAMMGQGTPSAFSLRTRSSPLMPGIRMSETTQSGTVVRTWSRNAAAVPCARALKPLTSSRKARESRMAGSSSMISTVGLSFMSRDLLCKGQSKLEPRAALGYRLGPDAAAMGLDDCAADRESDAHAVRLGADEGLEQAVS